MCYGEINENCSKLGHKQIGRDFETTMGCVSNTFEPMGSAGPNFQKDDNQVLREESIKWKAYGSAYWPSIVINERTYRGDMVPDSVLTAICSAFLDEPSYCTKFKEEQGIPTASSSGVTRNVLILVVVFLVVLNILIIFLYRRCQNREIKQDMQLQVNSAVSQYFALSTRNNTSMA